MSQIGSSEKSKFCCQCCGSSLAHRIVAAKYITLSQ